MSKLATSKFLIVAVVVAGLVALVPGGSLDAAVTQISEDCSATTQLVLAVQAGESVTWSVVGSACNVAGFAVVQPANSSPGLLVVDGVAVPLGQNRAVAQGSQVVYTAPASCSGNDSIYLASANVTAVFAISCFVPEPGSSVPSQSDQADDPSGSFSPIFTG